MRKPRASLALAAILLAAAPFRAAASPLISAGGSYLSYSSWEASGWLGFPSGAPAQLGFGTRIGLGLEGLPLERAWYEIGIGYRWLDRGEEGILPLPGAALRAGYRFPLAFLSLSPYAGAEILLPADDRFPRAAVAVDAGLRASFRLYGRKYLCLSPGFSWSFDAAAAPAIYLSASFMNEEPWKLEAEERAALKPTPEIFSPDGDGVDDAVSIAISGSGADDESAWRLRIVSPKGRTSRTFTGKGRPPEKITWNGKTDSGPAVEPGESYAIRLERPAGPFWMTVAKARVTIDILLSKEGDRYKIRVPDIRFPPDSYELGDATSSYLVKQNEMALSRIALLFKRFPGYSLIVEGHANSVHWADPEAYEIEERDELQPLSRRRAEAVREALMSMGVDGSRIKARAFGGTRPVYSFGDEANAWKNRRVEFILSRQ